MVSLLRKQLGPECDPNKWASIRTTIPVKLAWREVQAADTLAMYSRFVEMWPTQHALVADRIWELQHPFLVKMKRALALGFWLLWGAVAALVVVLFIVLPLLAHYFGK